MASTMEEYLYLAIYYNSPQANAVELGPCYAFIIGPDIDDSLTNQDQKLTQFFPIDYAGQYREIRLTSFVSEDFQEDIKKALHVPLDRSQWVQEALHNATSSNSIGPLPECFQDWAAIEQEIASRDCEARISQPFLRAPLQYPPYDLLNYRHNASFLELHPETSGPWIFVDVSEKIDWSLLIGPVRKRSGLRLERVQLIGKQYNISGNKNSELKEDTVPFNVQYEDSRTLTRTKVAKVSDAKVPNLEGIRKVLMEEGECFGSAHMVVRKLQQLFDEPTAEKAQTAVNWHYQQLAGQKLDRQNINHPLRGQVPLLDMQLGVCLLD